MEFDRMAWNIAVWLLQFYQMLTVIMLELNLVTKCLNPDQCQLSVYKILIHFFAVHYFFAAFCINLYLYLIPIYEPAHDS